MLCHLAARDDVIARAVDWLRPEGWLVIEGPYLLPANTSPFPAIERLMDAYERNHARLGADMTWARSLPATLARNGLTDVTHSGNLGCMT